MGKKTGDINITLLISVVLLVLLIYISLDQGVSASDLEGVDKLSLISHSQELALRLPAQDPGF